MLDKVLANALEGFTVIEDGTGVVGEILANQMATFAEAAGKTVGHINMDRREAGVLRDGGNGGRKSSNSDAPPETVRSGRSKQGAQLLPAHRYVVREEEEFDLIVIHGMSLYLYDKSIREIVETTEGLVSQSRQNRSFIVTLQGTMLDEKTTAYIEGQADSVIVVKTELAAERVSRSLFLQKLRGEVPTDRLIKFTLDEAGLQVDTREFLG